MHRWVLDSSKPRLGAGGEYLGYVGSVIDITERKRSELHDEDRLEILSDTVPALISYVDSDRRYVTCNAEYSKWFGLSREEIVGRPMRDVLAP